MKSKFFTSILIFCSLIFFSCESSKNIEDKATSKVFVTNSKSINILKPDCIAKNIDDIFLLSAKFGDTKFNIISYMQANENGIYLELLNDFGNSMGSLIYENNYVYLDCSFIPKKLKGEYIINDLQFVFYKTEFLEQNYENANLKFICNNNDEVEERFIYSGKKLIEKAEIQKDKIIITNYLRNYEYTLTSNDL